MLITLEANERKVIRLKQGVYNFIVKLVDLPNEYVEIYKCVSNQCKCIGYDVTDPYGVIEFSDSIEGLATITYRFIHNGTVFGELQVIPIVIDVNDVLQRVTGFIETLLFARRLYMSR